VERILDRAWRLIEAGGDEAATMSAVAREVGLSRQAVYFHFPDRTSLLVALARHIDDQRDLETWVARIDAAQGGVERLRTLAEMQAARNPRISPVARALDGSRHRDPAAAAAWRDQTEDRRRGCDTLITPALLADSLVHSSWPRDAVTTLVWEMSSFRVWDDLVNEAGMPPQRYVQLVIATVTGALSQPLQ
jgi:AcrR family transcriptional regulator